MILQSASRVAMRSECDKAHKGPGAVVVGVQEALFK